jgi:ADP-heptose:LPS heptosyltransferase
VIRTLPAVSALRAGYPHARIAWLVEPASRSGVEGQPWVDEVLVFPRSELREALGRGHLLAAAARLRAFLRALRSRRFDLVVDFHAILKSGLLARASGAPLRIAYARPYGRELSWLFAHRRARLSAPHASRFERNLALVRFLAVACEPSRIPFHLDEGITSRMRAHLGPGPAPVAIHPGTSPTTPHKRWSVEGFAALAKALHRSDGIAAVVTSGPDRSERAVAESIVSASEGAARPAPATPSLAELAALFSLCRLYIGGDTGPMHVASLVGTPVVQLLGPTDPVENAPYPGTPSHTVRIPLACSPCRRGCAAATCMRVLPPEAALCAARELLAAPQGKA